MNEHDLRNWTHSHTFCQDARQPGETRVYAVILITVAMMVAEIGAGITFRTMALLADGLHMGAHVVALGIAAFAYIYTRRHACDASFSFGAGKVNALGGFGNAIVLFAFAAFMIVESVERFVHPAAIRYTGALLVAGLGLVVNGGCALLLNTRGRTCAHGHARHYVAEHGAEIGHAGRLGDVNLKAAYVHVLADALTSLLAIFALLVARYLGFVWMDPAMGIVGALVVAWWSLGLLRTTSGVLLDRQGPRSMCERIAQNIEADGDSRVADLHLWVIGPRAYAAELVVVTHEPRAADEYKARIPQDLDVAHISVEVHRCHCARAFHPRRMQNSASTI